MGRKAARTQSSIAEEISKAPLPTKEHLLAKGTLMPFNFTNSGVRKLMFSTNLEQRLPLFDPDVPYVSTGYEDEFGKFSSSFKLADRDYEVIAKIPKFDNNPRSHYYLIIGDKDHTMLKMIERKEFQHLTETFGYIYANEDLDFLSPGDTISKGSVIHKSNAFSKYNNRMDGKNLLAMFNSSEETMEDSIIISESCSKKLTSPLVHEVNIQLNINEIPLNIFGDAHKYKIIPDIGEYTSNDLLCVIRREKNEDAFFSQDYNRLSQVFMSDDKITVSGRVVDIDIYCNNPDSLNEFYHEQLREYYNEHIKLCQRIVEVVQNNLEPGMKLDYELELFYNNCLAELNGTRFLNEKAYTGTLIKVTVVESIPALAGDKLTNRYGGKGVISQVKPDYMMPKTYDGETVDIQINICGVYGRENTGQLFEMSYTFRARQLVKSLADNYPTEGINGHVGDYISNILDFLEIVSPKQHRAYLDFLSTASDDTAIQFVSSIIDDGMLYIDVDPGTDTPSIDTIRKLNQRFPWIQQETLLMPLIDSTGAIKYVPSRRPAVVGHIYYFRLKQHSEEKFSVTSLSATNIKNENSRNKASKVYKAQFSRTPIRFGDMEIGDFSHMGIERAVEVLMLYAASPQARMLYEQAMTGNPYNVDIKLEDDSTNIGAEILATYLKTIGLRVVFNKIPKKKRVPIYKNPIKFIPVEKDFPYHPITVYAKDEYVDHEKILKRAELMRTHRYPIKVYPITFDKSPEDTMTLISRNTAKFKEELARIKDQEEKEKLKEVDHTPLEEDPAEEDTNEKDT